MELRHLRYFRAVAESMSFTAAARTMHVTQSTLSHQIKQLEDEIGQQLFDRNTQKVKLTYAGEMLLKTAVRVLDEVHASLIDLRSHSETRLSELKIGTTQTLNAHIMPVALAQFVVRCPSTMLIVEEFTHDGVAENVSSGALDMGLTPLPAALPGVDTELGVDVELLGVDELVLVVNPLHRLAKLRKIRMPELHRQEMVLHTRRFATRRLIDSLLSSVDAKPIVRIESVSSSLILDIVRRTQFAAIVTRTALLNRDDLVAVPLEGPTPERGMGLVWPSNKPRSRELDEFASIVRTVVRNFARQKRGFRLP